MSAIYGFKLLLLKVTFDVNNMNGLFFEVKYFYFE